MKLEADICYRAVKSRDKRFDGLFYTAVKTTGIYCRPICPARVPKLCNVEFYSNAAAAAAAGYRPCLRCRPETAPGTPAWIGTSASVNRAVRLIRSGYLTRGRTLENLAGKLGMTSRHLGRLFTKHLGISPKIYDQTLKLQVAKNLINSSNMKMSEVAFASGFESIRRFNEAYKNTFGTSPTMERNKAAGKLPSDHDDFISVQLGYRPPYAWSNLMDFFRQRALGGVELVNGDCYQRSVDLGDAHGVIMTRPMQDKDSLLLSVSHNISHHLVHILDRVRGIFDLDADPYAVEKHLGKDNLLKPAIKKTGGIRVPGCWDGFELAVRAIIGQLVSVKTATGLATRLVEKYGQAATFAGTPETNRLFPTAQEIARRRKISVQGLAVARADAILQLARLVTRENLDLSDSCNRDATLASLLGVKGIGPWTAQYIAMRAMHDPDAFPAQDLGLIKATGIASTKDIKELSENWRPWRAYAAMLLWSTL